MNPSVLLVDDNPVVTEALEARFIAERFRVSHARTAFDAMERLLQDPPHYVLLRLRLPEVDQLAFATALARLTLPPVVLLVRDRVDRDSNWYLARLVAHRTVGRERVLHPRFAAELSRIAERFDGPMWEDGQSSVHS
jgi:CheY-like chemotaxis protein